MRSLHAIAALLMAAAAAPAAATFHLIYIREVYVGPAADPNAQYVELQMYSAGENHVQGHALTVYGPTGTLVGTLTFPADVVNGASQAYILVATTQAEAKFGTSADLTMTALLDPAGGKVCWADVDCFSWGNYSGGSTTPSPSGTPFNAVGGLTEDMAVRRVISGGTNASQLDANDDTDDSASDFAFAGSPSPSNNASGTAGGGGGGSEGGYVPPGGGGGSGGGGAGSGGGGLSPLASLVLLLAGVARRRG